MADAMWERVSGEGGVETTRMRVAGGWLYRVVGGAPAGMALAFAPAGAGGDAGDAPASAPRGETTQDAPRSDD